MVMTVEELHKELDLERYSSTLKQIKGVWQKIKQAELAARRDPSKIAPYRSLLERAIGKSKKSDLAENDAAEALGETLAEHVNKLYATHAVDDRSTRRLPHDPEAWMQKHHPVVASRFHKKLEAFFERPSQESLQNAQDAVTEFVEVYSGVGHP